MAKLPYSIDANEIFTTFHSEKKKKRKKSSDVEIDHPAGVCTDTVNCIYFIYVICLISSFVVIFCTLLFMKLFGSTFFLSDKRWRWEAVVTNDDCSGPNDMYEVVEATKRIINIYNNIVLRK